MLKRILSIIVSVVTIVGFVPQMPAKAEEIDYYPYTLFAGSDVDGAITINADNVCLNGNIATNGTIVSSAPNFNINGIKEEKVNEEVIQFFKKIDNAYFKSNDTATYFEDYFFEDMNININTPIEAEGDISLMGNINITSGIKALNDVYLSGNVENTQDSVICTKMGNITIDTTNVNLNGIVYAPQGCVNITAQNLNINSVIIIADTINITCPNLNANYNSQMGEFIGIESETELELLAYGGYVSETNSINIYWSTTVPRGSFDIKISDDGENYISVGSVIDIDNFEFDPSEDFQRKYVKVIETTYYQEVGESIPFIINTSENGYSFELLDSDGDGLADIHEIEYGTDINNEDTDGDGLTDYWEVVFLKTDPAKFDSVKEGISDAYADSDGDGLSNIYELNNNSDPTLIDTDSDGLTDYEEVSLYATNPLLNDTDSDGIRDGDEIKLGLNPNNPNTYGVPDSEYPVNQTISENSNIFSHINTEDSPYTMSISVETNGNAEEKTCVAISKYQSVIENDAMLGLSTDILFDETCNLEKTVLKYSIDSDCVNDSENLYSDVEELQGIKRFKVFKYFDDLGTALPFKTEYDIENNKISANIYSSGTYCVMDIAKWFDMLESGYSESDIIYDYDYSDDADETDTDDENGQSLYIEPLTLSSSNISVLTDEQTDDDPEVSTISKKLAPLDVVFIVNCSGEITAQEFKNIIDNIKFASQELFKKSVSTRISIVAYGADSSNKTEILTTFSGKWASNIGEVGNIISQLNVKKSSINENDDFGRSLDTVLSNYGFRDKSTKFAFLFVPPYSWGNTSIYSTSDINVSDVVKYKDNWINQYGQSLNYNDLIFHRSGGTQFSYNDQFGEQIIEHISENTTAMDRVFFIKMANNLKNIYLIDSLSPYNNVHSDEDGLTDWEEVDTRFLIFNPDGSFSLPTFKDYINKVNDKNEKKSIEDLLDEEDSINRFWNSYRVLPVKSDPTEEDTDMDGIPDDKDLRPFNPDLNPDFELNKAIFESLDEYLNTIMPPVYTKDNKKINHWNAETCEETKLYFDKIILPSILSNEANWWSISHMGYETYERTMFHNWIVETYGDVCSGTSEKYILKQIKNTSSNLFKAVDYELTNNSDKIVKQIFLGNYSDDVTISGTTGQVLLGFAGVDFIADIRDISYDVTHWKFTWSHAGQTVIDLIAFIPAIGALKYSDEFRLMMKLDYDSAIKALNNAVPELLDGSGHLVKNSDEVSQLIKSKVLLKIVSDPKDAARLSKMINKHGIKVFSQSEELVNSILKLSDDAADSFIKVASKQGDEFFNALNKCGGNLDEIVSITAKKGDDYAKDVVAIFMRNGNKSSDELYSLFKAAARKTVRYADETEDAAMISRIKEIRSLFPHNLKGSGNMALADVSIEGIPTELYAHSRIDKLEDAKSSADKVKDIVLKPDNPTFEAFNVPNAEGKVISRDIDSEFKILNYIADELGNNTEISGKIVLFTELDCCASCSNTIIEFLNRYKNISIDVISNSNIRLKP